MLMVSILQSKDTNWQVGLKKKTQIFVVTGKEKKWAKSERIERDILST
jgi:hypothetical protein